jgi:hypothetical protein
MAQLWHRLGADDFSRAVKMAPMFLLFAYPDRPLASGAGSCATVGNKSKKTELI